MASARRPCGADGREVGRVRRDPHALELEEDVEEADRRADRDQDDHGSGGIGIHVPEQRVQGQRQEDPERHLDQVGGDADPDESSVGDQVAGGGRRVAGDVHRGVDAGKGEPAQDADHEIEEPRDPREAFG